MELRDAYFSTLYERVQAHESTFVIVGDFSAIWLEKIAADFPKQYLNCGIMEQTMISVAAGMAIQGRQVFVVGQNNFITLRAMEQISVDLCQMNLPVTLVGCSSGYSWNHDGPTHHGITDLGMMMQLPCEIFNPSDELVTVTVAQHEAKKPTYVRLGKGEWPFYQHKVATDGFRILRDGLSYIVTSGHMVHEAMKLVTNTDEGVIDLYRPHPLNVQSLRKVLKGAKITVLEDNLYGPIHKAVSAMFGRCASIAPQNYTWEYGSREFVQRQAGI